MGIEWSRCGRIHELWRKFMFDTKSMCEVAFDALWRFLKIHDFQAVPKSWGTSSDFSQFSWMILMI